MIHFRSAARKTGVDGRLLKRTARTLLKAVGEERSALSLSLVSDRTIRSLNRAHRGNDKPTDVLSFPLATVDDPVPHERLLGDVVISVDTARRQAAGYDAGIQDEVHRLLIHGILHVLGHDHEKARERVRMEAEERRLAAIIGMRWPY
ncbi:MAG: rRNA maturation RNase YbeY [Candidatus Eremiobacteraeota bacterium]|nr:rRNA maturation RNase YbeY [Candidatus Eremiobacteraeota bacterium]